MSKIQKILDRSGIKYKESGEHFIAKCPNCGKEKFYIHKQHGKFICFVCYDGHGNKEFAGGAPKGLSILTGISAEEIKKELYGDKQGLSFDFLDTIKKERGVRQETVFSPIYIPLKPLRKDDDGYKYLLKRGLTPEDISLSGALMGEKVEYTVGEEKIRQNLSGRVVFPVKVNDFTVGFIARAYKDGLTPKVLNAKTNMKKYVWGLHIPKERDILIITEGVISAIKTGIRRSISLQGKVISDEQLSLIESFYPRSTLVVLVPDPDAKGAALGWQKKLLSYFYRVEILDINEGKKDAGDLTHEEFEAKLSSFLSELGDFQPTLSTFNIELLR